MNYSRLFSACLWLAATLACATPRLPVDDNEVLERLPFRANDLLARDARALRTGRAAGERNLDLALRVADRHLAAARHYADPRFLGQAQAALAPWWNEAEPPMPVLVLRATLRQSNHEFAAALADLNRAVLREPRQAQAWLTKATVEAVIGDYSAARASCEPLRTLTSPAIYAACLAPIEGASGQTSSGLRRLEASVSAASRLPGGVYAWVLSLQAELAERAGHYADAEARYRASLALDPADSYTIAAYADYLLDRGRAAEVLDLVPADSRVDTLLLRRVLALPRGKVSSAGDPAEALAERYAAARARGDRIHLREEARFELQARGRVREALALARENWRQQKEPADLRVLLEAAVAARNRDAARDALAWQTRTGLEGEAIARLAAKAALL